jgi:hypothetical protein
LEKQKKEFETAKHERDELDRKCGIIITEMVRFETLQKEKEKLE